MSSYPKPLIPIGSRVFSRKGGGGYGNSLCPSFRHSVPHLLPAAYLQKYLRYQLQTSLVDRSH